MTNVNDLRIVKLYHVHSFDTNDYGFVIGINVLKDRSNFVLVKKCGDKYKIVPTDENQTKTAVVRENPEELYSLTIKKERKNNRYRKPFHICEKLAGKKLSKEELIKFARMIDSLDSDGSEEQTSEELYDTCESFENYLEHENNKNDQFSL